MGLATLGVVGILLEAKAAGHTARVSPHLDALRNAAGFFLSDALYQEVLQRANETHQEQQSS
jgi:predicted nucleic acid-binding protein